MRPDQQAARPELPLRVIPNDPLTDAAEARELTRAIRNSALDLEAKLVEAWQRRVWVPLGYESWDAWVEGEFKTTPLAFPRTERRGAVERLRGWGMSTRAIAPVLGVHKDTVRNDLAGGEFSPPASATGLDGKTYQRRELRRVPAADPGSPTVNHDPRKWAKKIEHMSAAISAKNGTDLTDEQLADALGAAEFLYHWLRGETVIRERRGPR